MELGETFNELVIPNAENDLVFNALPLNEFPFAKIAVNNLGFPILLISSQLRQSTLCRNIKLKYIELTFDNECMVSENDNVSSSNYIIVKFKSRDLTLQSYFLTIANTLLSSLSGTPSGEEIAISLKNFIEIFRALSDQPIATIQGLWSELFVIESSKYPEVLLSFWHNQPLEKFDFNAGQDKIEVKSSSQLNRVHTFSAEQLFAFYDTQILVASIFLKQSPDGIDILQLIESIQLKIRQNTLREKLLLIVSKTLGSALDQSIKVKFDYGLAKQSIQFYPHQEVAKIEHISIPVRVSDVHYKSDLSLLSPIIPNSLNPSSALFNAV